ncbi:MAG TPA: hypothetical protein VEH27_07300 [Methylomirabilota bacterium]|nr:hypothetical protein [Methylomirabilota bacterium]
MSEPAGSTWAVKILRGAFRVFMVAIFAIAVTFILNRSNTWLAQRGGLAGFGTGMLHGALMPGAMPGLMFGRDIPIYAEKNNGIPYKLGYTVGVNACGALFFGWTFWRLNRWRKRLSRSEASHLT